jgi:hypothetical protein
MNNCCLNNDIVDIVGLCNPGDIDLTRSNFWTEIVVDESLILPEQKPDIEQINSVNISVQITRKKVIATPISKPVATPENIEGKIVTGRKLIVEGLLCQSVSYTALVAEQSVHTAHFQVPFSAYIVVAGTTLLDDNFDVISCVEDVFIANFSKRQIFKNVNLFLQAIPAPKLACNDQC